MVDPDKEGPAHEGAEGEIEEGQGPDMIALQQHWSGKIEGRLKEQREYEEAVKRSIRLMRLDKDSRKTRGSKKSVMNIAWANFEVMRPAIYAQPPKPVVVPKFGGGDQRAAIDAACQAVERAAETMIERGNLHECMKFVRDDLLKAGRGTAWVRYGQQTESSPEKVLFDAVSWRDFLHGFAETWSKVPWVARGVIMSEDAFENRFGEGSAEECGVKFGDDRRVKDDGIDGKNVMVWEIWCKESRKTVFFVREALRLIEISEPLLNLDGFFPCPEPAFGSTEDGSLMPIPDVVFAEDQYRAIDNMTARIDALTDALKVRGFYPKGATGQDAADAIKTAVELTDDRQMLIPVNSWAANGTSDLSLVWWPVDQVIRVVTELMTLRSQAIELVYQVTGISDVMRGMTDPNETLGAQQLKAQSNSVRSRNKIEEVRRFARDMIRIGTEIMCEAFQPETLAEMAVFGMDQNAIMLVKDQRLRPAVIDVETDSTIVGDEMQEKKDRAEFTTVIGGLVAQMMPIIQQAPELVELAGEVIKFNAQAFRAGRTMERHIDMAIAAIKGRVQQQMQAPQQDPKAIAAQSKAEIDKQRLALDAEKAKGEYQIASGELQLKADAHMTDKAMLMRQVQQEEMAANMGGLVRPMAS